MSANARPKLMVIGDSLAQGCRSLSVNADLCAQSWPARVAKVQGWPFISPDFPRPILFDVEAEVRRLDTLTISIDQLRFEGIEGRIRDNLRDWLVNARESSFNSFDNLGLAGAKIYDLYTAHGGQLGCRDLRTDASGCVVADHVGPDR